MAIDSTQSGRPESRADERRLFVGMQPPPEVSQRLIRNVGATLENGGGGLAPGMRLMAPDDLHLTLCFLGAFPEARRAALEASLREELRGLDAPELTISGTGGFPDLDQPRVLWAGVDEERATCGRLHVLHNRTLQAAYSMRWRSPNNERRDSLRPHLTVARLGEEDAGEAAIHAAFGRLMFSVNWVPVEVTLFESTPDSPDERYRALASFPLVVRPG
ncbi:MAG: 2'-5' RNA ligase [Planctomycetota bacterium]|jgi:2'-5' RNA ligase